MKIAMLAQWSGPDFQRMAELANPAKQKYCGRFGYDFIAINQRLDPQRHPVWDKVLAIRSVLSDYDWVFIGANGQRHSSRGQKNPLSTNAVRAA